MKSYSHGHSDAQQSDVTEILRKVRRIELRTRGLVRESFGGEYRSSFKGEGIDFEDFREYQPGDEVRAIDWNVTARMRRPFVKKFTEEREMTVLLCVDISASGNYGSVGPSKREIMAEVSALIAFSALQNKDKVGLVLFSEDVELYLPPRKGVAHALRLIREVLHHQAEGRATSLTGLVHLLKNTQRKRALVFLLSDFLFPEQLSNDLRVVNRKHDLVAIQVSDPAELALPSVGRVCLEDPETGQQTEINTSNPRVRSAYAAVARHWQEEIDHQFKQLSIDKISLRTDEEYHPVIHSFFKRRQQRRTG